VIDKLRIGSFAGMDRACRLRKHLAHILYQRPPQRWDISPDNRQNRDNACASPLFWPERSHDSESLLRSGPINRACRDL